MIKTIKPYIPVFITMLVSIFLATSVLLEFDESKVILIFVIIGVGFAGWTWCQHIEAHVEKQAKDQKRFEEEAYRKTFFKDQ